MSQVSNNKRKRSIYPYFDGYFDDDDDIDSDDDVDAFEQSAAGAFSLLPGKDFDWFVVQWKDQGKLVRKLAVASLRVDSVVPRTVATVMT